jgi:hypothetical protein
MKFHVHVFEIKGCAAVDIDANDEVTARLKALYMAKSGELKMCTNRQACKDLTGVSDFIVFSWEPGESVEVIERLYNAHN